MRLYTLVKGDFMNFIMMHRVIGFFKVYLSCQFSAREIQEMLRQRSWTTVQGFISHWWSLGVAVIRAIFLFNSFLLQASVWTSYSLYLCYPIITVPLHHKVSDGIIAPGYSTAAEVILKAKKGHKYCILRVRNFSFYCREFYCSLN